MQPDDYTLGEILDIIAIHDEQMQVSWACSAQSPELLPEKYKKQKSKSANNSIKAHFE